MKTKIVGKVG